MMTMPKLKAPPGTCDTHMHIYMTGYPVRPEVAQPPGWTASDTERLRSLIGGD